MTTLRLAPGTPELLPTVAASLPGADLHGRMVGDGPTISTARELARMYRALRRAPGVPAVEIKHAREAAERWALRAGIRFDPDQEHDDAAD